MLGNSQSMCNDWQQKLMNRKLTSHKLTQNLQVKYSCLLPVNNIIVKVCAPNMHFSNCGSMCEADCSVLHMMQKCTEQCVPKCVCDAGFILFEQTCIKTEHCRIKTASDQTDCNKALAKAGKALATGMIGVFLPKCESNGDWSAMQCHSSTGNCWCSKPDGTEIENTKKQGHVICEDLVPQCLVNSHFNKCGSACEPECGVAEKVCNKICVARCVCDTGYILSKGACIKKEHCEGKPCPSNMFYSQCDFNCQSECNEPDQSCSKVCAAGCVCNPEYILLKVNYNCNIVTL